MSKCKWFTLTHDLHGIYTTQNWYAPWYVKLNPIVSFMKNQKHAQVHYLFAPMVPSPLNPYISKIFLSGYTYPYVTCDFIFFVLLGMYMLSFVTWFSKLRLCANKLND